MPTPPYQSKLIPHEDFIRECRARRWSYPRIAAALLEKHDLKVGATTVFDFVKVRAKGRRLYAPPPKSQAAIPKPISTPNPSTISGGGFFEPPPQPTKGSNEKRRPYNLNI